MKWLDYFVEQNAPVDSAFSWFIALCTCAYAAMTCGLYATSGVIFVLLQDRYDVTKEKASLPINTCISTSMIFGFLSGPIFHRLKSRKTFVLATSFLVLGCCLSVFSPLDDPIIWLTVCMAIRGIGMSLSSLALPQVLSSHFSKHRSTALMIYTFFVPLAALTMPSIFRSSAEEYGLEWSWLMHAAVSLQSLVLALVIKPRLNQTPKMKVQELESFLNTDQDKPKLQSDVNGSRQIMGQLLGDKVFHLVTLSLIIIVGTSTGFKMTIADYARDVNLDRNLNKFIFEIMAFAEIVRIPTAILMDRRVFYEETVFGVGSLLTSVILLLLTVTSGLWFVATGLTYIALYSFTAVALVPLFATLGVTKLTLSMGLASGVFGVAQLGLPLLIGVFRDVHGSYDYLFYTFSSLNLVLALALGVARVRKWINHQR